MFWGSDIVIVYHNRRLARCFRWADGNAYEISIIDGVSLGHLLMLNLGVL
jgi:hypothetical protein